MRQLASIQQIIDINPIPDADAIEVATVLGWYVVVKKGEFKVGDKVIYLEIDSWVPNTLAPFLSRKEPKEFNGVKGERLRTVKLRGQMSQGLILPLSVFDGLQVHNYEVASRGNMVFDILEATHTDDFVYLTTPDDPTDPDNGNIVEGTPLLIGADVTALLGIQKWEAPIAANLRGQVKGNWPSFLQKTDEDRIQGMPHLLDLIRDVTFIAHEKLDGSSMTVYNYNGVFGVCSRNLDLTESAENAYWQVANKYDLRNKLEDGYCIQGELVGPGVQGNQYNLSELDLYVFNVFNINDGKYVDTGNARLRAIAMGLNWVPFVMTLPITQNLTVDALLQIAEGPSALNPNQEREGLVWRPLTEMNLMRFGRVSFKTISNQFLLKGGD